MAEAKGLSITFHINTNGELPIVHSVDPSSKEVETPVVDKNTEVGDGFDVELLNKDRLDDSELIDLGQRIVLYVRELLDANKMGVLRSFMSKTKHHMGNEILGLVKDEIEVKKNGKQ